MEFSESQGPEESVNSNPHVNKNVDNPQNSVVPIETDQKHSEALALNEDVDARRMTPLEASILDDLKAAESLSPEKIPVAIVSSLSEDPFIAQQFEADAGVWEGYTIGGHTVACMTQFEKYFSDKLPDGIDLHFFRRFLALHDIGKPKALEEGDKNRQYKYNASYVEKILAQMGEEEDNIKLAAALLCGDIIGSYLKSGNLERAISNLQVVFSKASVGREKVLELLLILYQADAGSYTEDATVPGVIQTERSLDWLFDFMPEEKRMDFSAEVKPHIVALKQAVHELTQTKPEKL